MPAMAEDLGTAGVAPRSGGDDAHVKRHVSFDPASARRLCRLMAAFDRTASEVICRALEFQETGNNRLAKHGVREPLQALQSTWDELRPRMTRSGDDELLTRFERAMRQVLERLETADAPGA
jgi:hypothetical protein